MRSKKHWLLLAALALAMLAYQCLGLGEALSLQAVKKQQDALIAWRVANPIQSTAAFFGTYVLLAALSLPGAIVLTLSAGALFGLAWGVFVASFASTIGATVAFLLSRWLMRDWVTARFGERLIALNDGIAKDGSFYLLTLRLVPVIPFFIVNLAMGVTNIRTRTFYWASQVGMLAGTVVYVNAGTQLSRIGALSDVASPAILLSLASLAFFPFAVRRLSTFAQSRRTYSRWKRPRKLDRNVVVIGGGSAGLVTSYIAATLRAKVTLVEKHKLGGDCLNTGCVPSKALLRSAKFLSHVRRAREFGAKAATVEHQFSDVMGRVRRVIDAVEPHDSPERYRSLGVDVKQGTARIVSPWEVEVTSPSGQTQRITTRAIVIATGARPTLPDIPGIAQIHPLTSDNLWELRELPKRMVVLGGGPIGCELSQAFARLGSDVTLVERSSNVLPREDVDASSVVLERMQLDGVRVLLEHIAIQVNVVDQKKWLVLEHCGVHSAVEFDELLVAIGRTPNLSGYGLEDLGLKVGRTIDVNGYQQTNYPNIFAAGDVSGPFQLTHTAAHQAWYAAINALLHPYVKLKVDYRAVPWTTFTEPELARVGLNEADATSRGISYEVSRYELSDLDRAIADGEPHGFVKVLTKPGKDKILGVTIVGDHAGDMLAEYVLAVKHGIGLNKILGTIHTYPTFAEANKHAAGVWRRAHTPSRFLDWLEKINAWRRSS